MQKVIVIWLFVEKYLETDGTSSYSMIEADPDAVAKLKSLGPLIESIRTWTVVKNKTTNFGCAVHISGSILGRNYATPVIISADVTANGETVGAEYTASANYCFPHLTAMVGAHNTTGSARENATVSAAIVVTLKT